MDYVIIANAWAAAGDNPTGKHQIALQLAAKGHRVLWIEGAGMRRPSAGSGADRSRIRGKIVNACRGIRKAQPGIWVTAPLILPLPMLTWARGLNSLIYLWVGLIGTAWLRFRRPALINFLPVVPFVLRAWPWRAVYYCVDRWESFDMYDTDVMRHVDAACCRHADMVLTTSQDLQARCAPKNPRTKLIGHGVNWDHFAGPLHTVGAQTGTATEGVRPVDLPPGRVVGFFGLLSEWVDQDLLVALAGRLRAVGTDGEGVPSLVLIGKADVDIVRLTTEANIHVLGPKPFARLPEYVCHFDVGVIPFVVNELTIAVNPIKLREMLAAGCPVVSTALPEVEAVGRDSAYVDVTSSRDAFLDAVVRWVEHPPSREQRLAISDTMRSETWAAKVDEILSEIGVGVGDGSR